MAKPRTTDAERFNLMLGLAVYLLRQHEAVRLEDLAEHFRMSASEIRRVLSNLGVSGLLGYGPDDLFELDYESLEDGYALLYSSPIPDQLPRLSTRQAAALAAGLGYLEGLPGVIEEGELDELRGILARGAGGAIGAPVRVRPESAGGELNLLRGAIADERAIDCRYRDNAGLVTERRLEPVLLESRGEHWYLRAWCQLREGLRVFKVANMHEIAITDAPVGREAKTAKLESEIYTPGSRDLAVTVEVDPEGYRFIRDFAPEIEIPTSQDGVLRVSVQVGLMDVFCREVCRYGGHVRVLEPDSARLAVKNHALRLLGESPLPVDSTREE